MSDVEKAKELFLKAGLSFPELPAELAAQLKERGEWLYSTREIEMWPYNLDHYVHEADKAQVENYAILSHSGHGVNSYAIQYYLVYGSLRIFLFLGWGGVYEDAQKDAAKIRDCFSLADEIIPAVQTAPVLRAGDRLTIVGSDFYGSYWLAPGQSRQPVDIFEKTPAAVLAEVIDWLRVSM